MASGASPRQSRYTTNEAPFVPPAPSTIDLHTHTTRSDGVLQPADLVRAAFGAGVRTLAVTDHDTLAGVRELVRDGDIPLGVDLVTGVEINAVAQRQGTFLDAEVHILGYGMDLADEAFEAVLASQREARRVRFWATVERLR